MTPETILIALAALCLICPLAVYVLMDQRLRDVRRMYDSQIKEWTARTRPVEEILVVYGKLNQSLEEMLSRQIESNGTIADGIVRVARQVAAGKTPQPVVVPQVQWPVQQPEPDEDHGLLSAGEIQN